MSDIESAIRHFSLKVEWLFANYGVRKGFNRKCFKRRRSRESAA